MSSTNPQRRREDESDAPVREKSIGVTWGVFASVVIPLATGLVYAGMTFGGLAAKADSHEQRLIKIEAVDDRRSQSDSGVAGVLATLVAKVEGLSQRIDALQQQRR